MKYWKWLNLIPLVLFIIRDMLGMAGINPIWLLVAVALAIMNVFMAKSMTGFGSYEVSSEIIKITIEIKSVNHRFLDLNMKLPKKFTFFENDGRNLIKNKLSRGKVDVFVSYQEN